MPRVRLGQKNTAPVAPGAAGPWGKTNGRKGSESTRDPIAGLQTLTAPRASQDARGAEGIVANAVRVGFRIADDDVVDEVDVDHLGSFTELPGLWEPTYYGNWGSAVAHP